MKPRSFKYLPLVLLVLSIISCSEKRNKFVAELDDSTKQVIISYVKENNIDIKSHVITAKWVTNTYRTDIYISNSFLQLKDDQKNVPAYYSILADSIVVFVYSGIENLVRRNTQEISSEINQVLEKSKIKLNPVNGYLSHAPRWVYTSCEGKSKLIKKSSPLEWFHIPCGYMMLYDTLRNDSSYIVTKRMH